MRLHQYLAIALGLLLAATGLAADDKKDQDKVQGTWSIASVERAGIPLEKEDLKDRTAEFDGEKITFNGRKGAFKLDSSKKLKEITVTFDDGKVINQGIYELYGDTLKLCAGAPGEERPKEFKSAEGSKTMLLILKRKK